MSVTLDKISGVVRGLEKTCDKLYENLANLDHQDEKTISDLNRDVNRLLDLFPELERELARLSLEERGERRNQIGELRTFIKRLESRFVAAKNRLERLSFITAARKLNRKSAQQ